MNLRIGVIGVGNMGKHHARVYSTLLNCTFVAVADLNEKLGSTIAKKHHIKFYSDFKEMIAQEKLDAVSICVPTKAHFPVAKACLEQNLHVLLEKPITPTVEEGKKLIALAKKQKVTFMVGHIERHNPAIKKVKEMIQKGDLGKITALITRRVGGFPPQIKDANIVVDLGIHDIDVANYLLEEIPTSVSINKQKHHIELREDSVEIFMKYKKASAYIQANWISPVKIRKLNITGTEGYLEMDYITQKIDFYKSNYSKFKEASKDYSDYILLFSEPDKMNISVAKKEPLKEELMYFLDAIQNNRKINTTYAINALEIALAT